MAGLYIHVPFCQKRCHYCSFYSTTFGKEERDLYVQALLRELAERADTIAPHLSSVYFGGGTPSQLDLAEVGNIFEALYRRFDLSKAEITFECNPDDVTPEYAAGLATVGVNRISMGVQSFDDDILRSINRRHTAAQVHDAIRTFHEAGIHNISIDLIYGLPHQSMTAWERDLDTAIMLSRPATSWGNRPAITHLSSYALSIEEGTPLYYMRARGELQEIDEESSLAMYNRLIDKLTEAGFEHYEISNFSLPGFHSRHNTSYWSGAPYLGLGPGAHSYDGNNKRRWNEADLTRYITTATAPHDEETLSREDLYNEKIITRLRTKEGMDLAALDGRERQHLERQAAPFLTQGLMLKDGTRIVLTRKGIFISDSIFTDLMMET